MENPSQAHQNVNEPSFKGRSRRAVNERCRLKKKQKREDGPDGSGSAEEEKAAASVSADLEEEKAPAEQHHSYLAPASWPPAAFAYPPQAAPSPIVATSPITHQRAAMKDNDEYILAALGAEIQCLQSSEQNGFFIEEIKVLTNCHVTTMRSKRSAAAQRRPVSGALRAHVVARRVDRHEGVGRYLHLVETSMPSSLGFDPLGLPTFLMMMAIITLPE
ncbi:hypothetical protein PC128_g23131 [Phytophthora cactorum]|nr:hypothetical protein PC128_g23131 [Phytophthora cactorum]